MTPGYFSLAAAKGSTWASFGDTVRDMDPLLKNAGREARAALLLFGIALAWTLGVAAWMGYGRSEVRFILGLPDWVFWGVFLPWGVFIAVSLWFGLRYMKDDDLGPERREGVDE